MQFLYALKEWEAGKSAADVMVVLSKQEAFGQTASEAMACGTPAVCFDRTGPKDIVDHKINGYKSKAYDTEDLKEGVIWVLNNTSEKELGKNASRKVQFTFESKIRSREYLSLYKECLY